MKDSKLRTGEGKSYEGQVRTASTGWCYLCSAQENKKQLVGVILPTTLKHPGKTELRAGSLPSIHPSKSEPLPAGYEVPGSQGMWFSFV